MSAEVLVTLLLSAGAGLLGSMHCVGMCGAFVLCVGRAQPERALRSQLVYALGRSVAYGFLGALFGLAGSFAALAARLTDAQGYLFLVAGLLVTGLALMRMIGTDEPGWLQRFPDRLHRSLGATRRQSALFAFGALNAMVPCGLLYTMELRAAASADVVLGFLILFCFALGTIPALALLGVAGAKLGARGRLWIERVGALLVALLGVQIVLRAAAHLGWIRHTAWF